MQLTIGTNLKIILLTSTGVVSKTVAPRALKSVFKIESTAPPSSRPSATLITSSSGVSLIQVPSSFAVNPSEHSQVPKEPSSFKGQAPEVSPEVTASTADSVGVVSANVEPKKILKRRKYKGGKHFLIN